MYYIFRTIKSTLLLIFVLLTAAPLVLHGQILPKPAQSQRFIRLCGTPLLTPEFIEKARMNTLALYPEMMKKGLDIPEWERIGLEPVVGDSLQFWALNIKDEIIFYETWAELRAVGNYVYIWVEKSELNSGLVTDNYVTELLNAFEESTPSGSIDPNKGIVEIEREVFGFEPNFDGDYRTDILLLDIQDYFDGHTNLSYVSGFFNERDQTYMDNSNRRDMLYLDTYPTISQNMLLTTAAHEYQHLIHYNYDKDEINLINEGASQLAQFITGHKWDDPTDFFTNTDISLLSWGQINDPDVFAHYAKVQMWMTYLWDQFGQNYVRILVQDGAHGIVSLSNTITALGAGFSFNDVLRNWFAANYLNDTGIDPAFGYTTLQALSVKANLLLTENNYPTGINNEELDGYAAEYVRFTNGYNLSGLFTSSLATVRAINQSEYSTQLIDVPVGVSYTDSSFGVDYKETVFICMNETETQAVYSYEFDAYQPYFVREVYYDDGTPDIIKGQQNGIWWGTGKPGYGWAVKFSPLNENSFLLGAKAYVTFIAGVMGNPDFLFRVYDDSGVDGKPGNELIPQQPISLQHSENYYWWEIDLSDFENVLSEYHGDYYLSLEHLPDDSISGIFIAVDNSQPDVNHSWGLIAQSGSREWKAMSELKLGDEQVSLAPFDLMIRAVVSYIEPEPPVFSCGYLQNPVFTENFDIYVIGEKELNPNRLTGTVTIGDNVETLNFIYSGNTEKIVVDNNVSIDTSGVATLYISGTNKYGVIERDTTIEFTVQIINPNTMGKISTPSCTRSLIIPAESVMEKITFSAIDGLGLSFLSGEPVTGGEKSIPVEEAAAFGPAGLSPEYSGFELRFNYQTESLESRSAENLYIARLQDGVWFQLNSIVDEQTNTVTAFTDRLGTFQLRWSEKSPVQSPEHYALESNYPNPFNQQTVIKFAIKNDEFVTLKIYNLLGREVRTLKSEYLPAGYYNTVWDGTNAHGAAVASGIYFYRLQSGSYVNVNKMVLIR